jgi:putative SOS response-associated peptidase YedK
VHPLRWGLIPSWAKEAAIGQNLLNGRAETAHDKPAFRAAFRRRHCLLPASGFYEWTQAARKKQPHYFTLKTGQLFAFAGLWERWHAPDCSGIESCAILTTEANEVLRTIHHRMPVILPPAAYGRWLKPGVQDLAALADLLCPYPAAEMTAFPVSTQVNSPKIDDPLCVALLSVQTPLC